MKFTAITATPATHVQPCGCVHEDRLDFQRRPYQQIVSRCDAHSAEMNRLISASMDRDRARYAARGLTCCSN
jgi:hypothetical protein